MAVTNSVLTSRRAYSVGFGLLGLLLFGAMLHAWGPEVGDSLYTMKGNPLGRSSFLEIATKYKTDKTTAHSYHHMYTKYLEPIRDRPLKMLEIGLGCTMNYGPGASYNTWLEFLPNVELYFIEYDAACAKKWAHKTEQAAVYTGDQSDVAFLQRFIEETGGNFDIIVDDGGHTMKQQKVSFNNLMPAVKPGGLYFCEDLHTSFMAGYKDDVEPGKPGTMVEMITEGITELVKGGASSRAMESIYSIDCMKEVCAFTKKTPKLEY